MNSKGAEMTEECAREMFTPVAVCPRCNRKLTVYELHSTYKQNWLLRHELFRRLVYECKYCRTRFYQKISKYKRSWEHGY